MRPARSNSGLTLIETLAVVVLLGAISSLVLLGLNRRDDNTKLRIAEARMRHLDRTARIFAQTEGGSVIRPASSETKVTTFEVIAFTDSPVDQEGVVLLREALPDGVSGRLSLETPVGPTRESVAFDRAGRTTDYTFTLQAGDSTWRRLVSGATGWQEALP